MEDILLLPFESLEKYLEHPSPKVRSWAWERLEEIYPERIPDFVSLALKEEDRGVFTEAIRIFRDHVSLIPSEKRKLLKDAIVERLRKEENEQLLLVSVGFLGAIKSFTTIITETPGFWKK